MKLLFWDRNDKVLYLYRVARCQKKQSYLGFGRIKNAERPNECGALEEVDRTWIYASFLDLELGG